MEINKNSPEAGTCYGKQYKNFFVGINYQTKDTFFFSFIIQFILVALMYSCAGKGNYWKVLYYSSVMGLIGAFFEHSTLAYICQKSQENHHTVVVTFFIEEFCWIVNEYSISILNLIKMKTVVLGTQQKIVKYLILTLLIPFSIARLYDGYDRMMKGYLNTDKSKICHGIAFGILGISDIICTTAIIYHAWKKGKNGLLDKSISGFLKNSSFTTLIIVDMVSLLLSILYIISTLMPSNTALASSTTLFHCLKSVFILILGIDSFIFKYEVADSISTLQLPSTSYSSSMLTDTKSIPNLLGISKSNSNLNNKYQNMPLESTKDTTTTTTTTPTVYFNTKLPMYDRNNEIPSI
ncbi:hypothetical protein PIROE2DRAFT_11008 [Piromyces sp. E2]|nr:hypothetical protein PIROE2DRAFT_11008 [Piromyces sp. E2]|eukprot:OUM62634.1 hypothetical protein PIROE2DRAFT_11008 [Piromyces sp. E2]